MMQKKDPRGRGGGVVYITIIYGRDTTLSGTRVQVLFLSWLLNRENETKQTGYADNTGVMTKYCIIE